MRIIYIDAGVNWPRETYSAKHASRYGGGACFARYALIMLNNSRDIFHILGPKESFNEIGEDENPNCCFGLEDDRLHHLRGGGNVRDILPSIDDYDIVIHHHDVFHLNTDGCRPKSVHWALMGDNGAQHPRTPYTLLYRPGEQARHGRGFPVTIGKFVPSHFVPGPLRRGIFQCSRHDVHTNSIAAAQFCLSSQVEGCFAGPILDNYPLMEYIDDKVTFYRGLVSEREKLERCRSAVATTYLHTWETAFNLSAVESLSVGTPIIASNRGCFRYLLQEGTNGFYWKPGDDMRELYEKCRELDQEKVWQTAHQFSHIAMVNSFYKAFQEISNAN